MRLYGLAWMLRCSSIGWPLSTRSRWKSSRRHRSSLGWTRWSSSRAAWRRRRRWPSKICRKWLRETNSPFHLSVTHLLFSMHNNSVSCFLSFFSLFRFYFYLFWFGMCPALLRFAVSGQIVSSRARERSRMRTSTLYWPGAKRQPRRWTTSSKSTSEASLTLPSTARFPRRCSP